MQGPKQMLHNCHKQDPLQKCVKVQHEGHWLRMDGYWWADGSRQTDFIKATKTKVGRHHGCALSCLLLECCNIYKCLTEGKTTLISSAIATAAAASGVMTLVYTRSARCNCRSVVVVCRHLSLSSLSVSLLAPWACHHEVPCLFVMTCNQSSPERLLPRAGFLPPLLWLS